MHPILFWAGIAILYLITGYQMAIGSLEVYHKWGQKDDDTFNTWFGLRLIFFPLNSLNLIWTRDLAWFFVDSSVQNHKENEYIVLTMIIWPARIVWFGFVFAIFYTIIPVASLVLFVFWRTLRGLFSPFKGLFMYPPVNDARS